MICAIHQPNFIPWLPYFDKIAQTDVFIFLDEVAYPKSGKSMGSWCNRVKIDMHGQELWFALPVVRESGVQLINMVEINYKQFQTDKWLYTLDCAYSKYANFADLKKLIIQVLECNYKYCADFNVHVISGICKLLKLKTKFVRQSELGVNSAANELLIELCQKIGANQYLSGTGALDYMDNELFKANDIEVIYQTQNYLDSVNSIKKYSILHYLITNAPENWEKFNVKA